MRTSMRTTALAGLIVFCAVLLQAPGTAEAIPGQDKTHTYYSDSSFRKVVGEEIVLSCGRAVRALISGRRSNFYKADSASCDGGGVPTTRCTACDRAGCHYVFPCPPPGSSIP